MKKIILLVSVFVSSLIYSQNLDYGTQLAGVGAAETVYYMMTKPEIVNEEWNHLFSDSLDIRLSRKGKIGYSIYEKNVSITRLKEFLNLDVFEEMRNHKTTWDIYAFVTTTNIERTHVFVNFEDLEGDSVYEVNIDYDSKGAILSVDIWIGDGTTTQEYIFSEGSIVYLQE